MRAAATPARNHRPLLMAILAAALLLPALLALVPRQAEARVIWCAGDPAIVVNGNIVSVTAQIPLDRLQDVDYVEVVFHVPANAKVTAVINDSVLFEARPRVVYDQPPAVGLLRGTRMPVDIIVYHRGPTMPVAATTVALDSRTPIWTQGTSAAPLRLMTYSPVNLRLP